MRTLVEELLCMNAHMRTCYENGWEFYSVCVNVSQVITKPMCSILLTFPRILPVSVVFNSFPKAQKNFFSLCSITSL